MSAENMRPPREWRITSLDNNDDGPAILVEGPNADCVHVIEHSAYDALATENERLRVALERISKGQECSACSCECHAIAMEVLKK